MYNLSNSQIDFIINDISARGVKMQSLQEGLLDHICCIIEENLDENGDFESFYQSTLCRFYQHDLCEIEEETQTLLTFKNYYTMKKAMIISGTVAVIAFTTGSLFKIMHWPGASPLLILGIISASFIFLPLMFILKTKEATHARDKWIAGLATLVGILFCLSAIFKVQHWPGGNVLTLSTIAIAFFVFIPVFFFSGIRRPETKTNTILVSIILVIAIGVQFMQYNMRKSIETTKMEMYNLYRDEQLVNEARLPRFNPGTEKEKLALSIIENCGALKAEIFGIHLGTRTIPANFEAKNLFLNENPLGDINHHPQLVMLFNKLRAEVSSYNTLVENTIPTDHSVINLNNEQIGHYSNLFVLKNLTQIQLFLSK